MGHPASSENPWASPPSHSPLFRPQLGIGGDKADGAGCNKGPSPQIQSCRNFFLSWFIIRTWADGSSLSLTLLLTSLKERGTEAADDQPDGAVLVLDFVTGSPVA